MLYVRCRCLCLYLIDVKFSVAISLALTRSVHSGADCLVLCVLVLLAVVVSSCSCSFFLPVCVLFFSGFKDFKNITKFIAPALTRIYFLLRPERIINLFFTRFIPFPSSSSSVCGVILVEGPQRPPYRPDSLSVVGFPSLSVSLSHTYQNYRIMQNAFKTKERKKDKSKSKQKKTNLNKNKVSKCVNESLKVESEREKRKKLI